MRQTSLDAFESVKQYLRPMEEKVLSFIRSQEDHGATLHEIAAGTGLLLQSVCGARLALEQAGLVVDSGDKRKTPSNRNAIVWVSK